MANDTFFPETQAKWKSLQDLPSRNFDCGYCSKTVSSVKGYAIGQHQDGSGAMIGAVYICPNCRGPVFFTPSSSNFQRLHSVARLSIYPKN